MLVLLQYCCCCYLFLGRRQRLGYRVQAPLLCLVVGNCSLMPRRTQYKKRYFSHFLILMLQTAPYMLIIISIIIIITVRNTTMSMSMSMPMMMMWCPIIGENPFSGFLLYLRMQFIQTTAAVPPCLRLSLPMTLFDSLLNTIRDLFHFRQRFQIQNAFRQLSVCSGNSTLIVGSILKITETTSPENYFQWEILQKSITRK